MYYTVHTYYTFLNILISYRCDNVTAATPQPKYDKGDEDQWERSVSSDHAYYDDLLDYDHGSDAEHNMDT